MNFLHSVHVWVRLKSERVPPNVLHGDVKNVIVSELLNLFLMCASIIILRRIWETGETSRSEYRVKSIELNAASSLLAGLFDAVVELDNQLRLTDHFVKLS
eukprot:TRINITY_DN20401_c0_g1_i1.p1 TRINITY_DN20401_c0_g1~~TRINITY_DN20401_c0_g1_i1.p1  ORF type:complete len:101 (-),score=15.79 TRINITY_DN20401_c0_g1_i1:144-446(-)